MSCETASKNATPPTPAWAESLAPGAQLIDPAAAARTHTTDPRLAKLIPGFDAPFFQAGLAGYSDAAMRIVARKQGCPMCVTEALLDRTLIAGGRGFAKADLGELQNNVPGGADDQPLVGQIMGCAPDEMAAAAVKMVEQAKRPPHEYRKIAQRGLHAAPADRCVELAHLDAHETTRCFASIDVNLACPVKKIRSKARGGHWLADPDGAIDILRAVRDALPSEQVTSVKMRRGIDDSQEAEHNFMRILDGAFDLGYGFVTVHGRTVEQKYIGPSRWSFLRTLVQQRPDAMIFGSGDIWDVNDIFRMVSYTGVKAVSVARGAIGNPWIFRQARQMMAGKAPTSPTIAEQRQVLLHHFELSAAVNGEHNASRMMRKFGVRFAQHHPDAVAVRVRFINVASISDWHRVLEDHYVESTPVRTDASPVRTHSADAPETSPIGTEFSH